MAQGHQHVDPRPQTHAEGLGNVPITVQRTQGQAWRDGHTNRVGQEDTTRDQGHLAQEGVEPPATPVVEHGSRPGSGHVRDAEQGNLQREELSRIVVANLNGYDVSAREVERALTELPPFQRFYYSSPEKITVFLRAYALMQLLSVQAVDAGLAKRPYVLMVLEEKLAARYKLVYLANRVKPSDITEEEIKRYLREPVDRRGFPGGLVEKETAAKAAILDARRQEAWYRHLVELGLSPTHAQPTGLQQ